MAKNDLRTMYECNRCGTKTEGDSAYPPDGWLHLTRHKRRMVLDRDMRLDLCVTCSESFGKWYREKENT